MTDLKTVPPTSLANRTGRALWFVVWLLLYRPSPRPLHFWRRWLLRLFGATVESGAKPYPSARIWAPWNLAMGARSILGDEVDCYSVDKVALHAGATVSQRTFLCTASRDYNDPAMPLAVAPITVAEHGWVAAECFVAPGVIVHEGAVCAARSVVTKNVEPWSVVGGHPAKKIADRTRF